MKSLSDDPGVTLLRLAEIKAAKTGRSPHVLPREPKTPPMVVCSLQEQAVRILRQAKERASHIEKEAYERGYAQGEKDGLSMGEKRFEATARTLSGLLGELSTLRAGLLGTVSDDLAGLALAVAGAVIRAEVSCGSDTALRAAQEAVESLGDDAAIVVKLNPKDLDYLKRRELLPKVGHFQADARISPGGCVAESEQRRFDARVERQMATLEEALRSEMGRNSDSGGGIGPRQG
ncbi:MAG: FliH/SctL family protein [Pseudomonadota bacterium]